MTGIPLERPYSPEYIEAQLKEAGVWRALRRVVQLLVVLLTGLWWRWVDRWTWTYRRGETTEDRLLEKAPDSLLE